MVFDRAEAQQNVEAFIHGKPRFWIDVVSNPQSTPMDAWGTIQWAMFCRTILAELEQAEAKSRL